MCQYIYSVKLRISREHLDNETVRGKKTSNEQVSMVLPQEMIAKDIRHYFPVEAEQRMEHPSDEGSQVDRVG